MLIIKKILSVLGVLAISASSSAVLACGVNDVDDSEWTNPSNDTYYELFGKYFDSKEDAINNFLVSNNENGVKVQKYHDIYNQLLLGENKFQNFDEIFSHIDEKFEIKELETNKNVDDYLIDSLGQLYPEVLGDQSEEVVVFKDANGNVVSESSEDISKKVVNESYTDKIEEFYYVNGETFENESDIYEYYNSQFLSKPDGIKVEDTYKYGNYYYNENGLKQQIENSIEIEYETASGNRFLDNQRNDLSVIEPTKFELAQISNVYSSPGMYNLEQIDTKDGVYTGDSIIESNYNIKELVLDKNNWRLVSSETESAKEYLINLVVSEISKFIEQLIFIQTSDFKQISNLNMLENRFRSQNSFSFENIFKGFGYEEGLIEFKNLIEKYGLIAETNASINSVKNIQNMDFSTLTAVFLYQMKEAFRYTNISREDNLKLNEVYYKFFLKYDNKKEWINFVEQIGKYDATYISDFLVNRSEFQKFNKTRSDFFDIKKIIEKLADICIEYAEKSLDKLIDDVLSTVKKNTVVFESYLAKIIQLTTKAQKALLITGIVLEILDIIPVTKTKKYELSIPDTSQKLEYQMTNFILSSKSFNPSELFRITELKKPIKRDMFLYEERYFPNFEDAVIQLKKNIIEDTIKNGKKTYFSSNDLDKKSSSREELVTNLLQKYMSSANTIKKYSDFFGEVFDNQQAALASMTQKIKNKNYNTFYRYLVQENEFRYFETYNQAVNYVMSIVDYSCKKVAFSDMIEGKLKFDELYDLNNKKTTIYSCDLYGVKYYFKDELNLKYFIMKKLNFKNNLIEIEVEQFWLNGEFFLNKIDYIDYLNKNIKEVDLSEINENLKGRLII